MQSIFGTDGIRAKVGQSVVTVQGMIQLGKAVGSWMLQQKQDPVVLIATDTRHSASLLKNAFKTGLLQHPVTIYDAQILPTPALFYHTVHTQAYDFGIMLTASHNQYSDNGIKIFTKKNGKLTQHEEHLITQLFFETSPEPTYEILGCEASINGLMESYLEAMRSHFPDQFLQGIKLVLDTAHGAYTYNTSQFLESLGAHVISIGKEPNGKNINLQCGSLYPEYVAQLVTTHNAHAGFAFDGDGDRLIAIAQDGTIKDGDELLGFLMSNPVYQQTPACVGTILSNQALENYVNGLQKPFYRTPVGDKLVVQKMKEINALLGGEPSGHLILRDFSNTADGLFVLLQVVYTALLTENWLFSSFTKFPQAALTVPVSNKKDLTQAPYASLISLHEKQLEQGRLIVRYSGTEPLLRIMAEAPSYETAHSVATNLSHALAQALTQE